MFTLSYTSLPRLYLDDMGDAGQAAAEAPPAPESAPESAAQESPAEPFFKYGEQSFNSADEVNSFIEKLNKQNRDKDSYIGRLQQEAKNRPEIDVDSVAGKTAEETARKIVAQLFDESDRRQNRANMSAEELWRAEMEDRVKGFDPDKLEQKLVEKMTEIVNGRVGEATQIFEAANLKSEIQAVNAKYPELSATEKGKAALTKLIQKSLQSFDPARPTARVSLMKLVDDYVDIASPFVNYSNQQRSDKADVNAAKGASTPGTGAPPPPPQGEKKEVPTDLEEIKRRVAERIAAKGRGGG